MAAVRTAGSLRMGPRTLRATLSLLVGYEEGSDVDLMIGHFLEDHAATLLHFNDALMPVLALKPDGTVSDEWKTPAAVASMSPEDIGLLVPALHVALYTIPNVKEKDSTTVRLQSFLSGIQQHFRYLKDKLTGWDFNSYTVEAPELPARDDASYAAKKKAFDYITSVSHPSKFIDGALKIALELRANCDARSKEVTKDGSDNNAKDKSRSLVKLFGQHGQGLLAKLPEEDARFVNGKCANATSYDLKETCPEVLNRNKAGRKTLRLSIFSVVASFGLLLVAFANAPTSRFIRPLDTQPRNTTIDVNIVQYDKAAAMAEDQEELGARTEPAKPTSANDNIIRLVTPRTPNTNVSGSSSSSATEAEGGQRGPQQREAEVDTSFQRNRPGSYFNPSPDSFLCDRHLMAEFEPCSLPPLPSSSSPPPPRPPSSPTAPTTREDTNHNNNNEKGGTHSPNDDDHLAHAPTIPDASPNSRSRASSTTTPKGQDPAELLLGVGENPIYRNPPPPKKNKNPSYFWRKPYQSGVFDDVCFRPAGVVTTTTVSPANGISRFSSDSHFDDVIKFRTVTKQEHLRIIRRGGALCPILRNSTTNQQVTTPSASGGHGNNDNNTQTIAMVHANSVNGCNYGHVNYRTVGFLAMILTHLETNPNHRVGAIVQADASMWDTRWRGTMSGDPQEHVPEGQFMRCRHLYQMLLRAVADAVAEVQGGIRPVIMTTIDYPMPKHKFAKLTKPFQNCHVSQKASLGYFTDPPVCFKHARFGLEVANFADPRTPNTYRASALLRKQVLEVSIPPGDTAEFLDPESSRGSSVTGAAPAPFRIHLMQRVKRAFINIQEMESKMKEIVARHPEPRVRAAECRVILLENQTTADQVIAFASANIVIMAHGAGLGWSWLLRPDTTVLEVTYRGHAPAGVNGMNHPRNFNLVFEALTRTAKANHVVTVVPPSGVIRADNSTAFVSHANLLLPIDQFEKALGCAICGSVVGFSPRSSPGAARCAVVCRL